MGDERADAHSPSPIAHHPPPAVLDGLAALVDASLLQRVEPATQAGDTRFAMLETIREYGLEQLAASGEEEPVRDRHAAYCLALAERANPELSGPEQAVWFARLEAEHANLTAGLQRFRQRGDAEHGLRLANALSWFWSSRGYLREDRGWLETFLALPSADSSAATRALALREAGNLAHWQGDLDAAEAFIEQARIAYEALGDPSGLAVALRGLGSVAINRGDPERAATRLAQSRPLFEQVGTPWDNAFATYLRGRLECVRGDYAAALDRFAEAVGLFRAAGDRAYVGGALGRAGAAALLRGDLGRAREAFAGSLAIAVELGEGWWIAWGLIGCALLSHARCDAARAARLLAAADALYETLVARLGADEWGLPDQVAAAARSSLGAAAFAAAWACGHALPLDAAVAEAEVVLAEPLPLAPAAGSAPAARIGLTRRERDVLGLLVEGRTDREIAAALGITRRTASKHVAAILAKLKVPSRAAAAAMAARDGLV